MRIYIFLTDLRDNELNSEGFLNVRNHHVSDFEETYFKRVFCLTVMVKSGQHCENQHRNSSQNQRWLLSMSKFCQKLQTTL